ncbi:MAG TPA: phosphotransferase, partial [Acidimicrobiales bacterium]|nr:phosphotransferase [Acidimicrobiales bacterium]
PLSLRSELFLAAVTGLDSSDARRRATSLWHEIVDTPPWTGPSVWLHGDLHPSNVLVLDGRVSAVIDFGDITAGDPATDLAVAWMMLPAAARATFRATAGPVDDHTWRRARGWALALAVAILSRSADNQVMNQVARRTLDAVLDER